MSNKQAKRAKGQKPLCLDGVFAAIDNGKKGFLERVKMIAPWFAWDDYSFARLETKIMMTTGYKLDELQSLTTRELHGVIDAITESTHILQPVIESTPSKKKSRQQPDRPATTWVRANCYKHQNNVSETVRKYVELNPKPGDSFKTVLQNVKYDLRKKPLEPR